jgi:hypothetical protein
MRSGTQSSLSTWGFAVAAGAPAFALVAAFYTATLLPGVAYWDTGEMQTVPYVLGIAHPTGFPAFVLGGWLFSHAVPLATPAWRLSWFSALASAAAAGALATFVAEATLDAFVGVAAAAVFAAGDVAWTRGVRAEVHDLALACIAVALAAGLRAARDGSARPLGLAAVAGGFGAATHPVAFLALPGVCLVAWPALARAGARTLALLSALALAPLGAYAYLPLRSSFVESHRLDPALEAGVRGGAIWDDGAPSTPSAFVRYVSGASFGAGDSFAQTLGANGLARWPEFERGLVFREYSYLVLTLAACGLTFLALRRPYVAAGLAAVAVAGGAFAANFSAESDPARYALPGLWATAACAGVGGWWVASAVAGERRALRTLLACALLAAGLWPSAPAAARDLARMRQIADARDIGREVGRFAEPGSLVVASWTFATPLAYDAYVARTFEARLVCGWPRDYADRFAEWRRRFGHVYFVVSPRYVVAPFAHALFSNARYQIAELGS